MLTDWEHSAERFRYYDALVWGLRSRHAVGLPRRIRRFLAAGELADNAVSLLPSESAESKWRESALSMFILEEVAWITEDSLSGPRKALSDTAVAVITLGTELPR